MQAGFAMLEAGIVQPKNATNILFKNMIDASLAAICFWLLGYGFAYGADVSGFIGNSNFAIDGECCCCVASPCPLHLFPSRVMSAFV